MSFAELTEFDFHARMAATGGIALVMFSGPDCGACRRMEKHLPQWLSDYADHFYKVDVQRSTALARAYEVFHLPALFVFVDGHYHGPLHAEAAPAPLIAALGKLISEPAREEP
ncbi:MAG: thioredoxin family protein [Hydrogenophilaceae bacterium]|nr:thioredoxin family protein [Hydrogenophilaceae bacterium]